MTYLLDTHTIIWAITEPSKLSPRVQEIIKNPGHRIVVNAITFWEIALKSSIGKLTLTGLMPQDLPAICTQMEIEIIPLDAEICATYHLLNPMLHRDPFDRMLIWLAKCNEFIIISCDKMISSYQSEGVKVIW